MLGRTMKIAALMIGVSFVLGTSAAHANLKQIKVYKETFPESKPKCINCHETEKPKKDEGLHEGNDYGKAAMKLEAHPTAETFKQLGSFDDFEKKAEPAAEEKK